MLPHYYITKLRWAAKLGYSEFESYELCYNKLGYNELSYKEHNIHSQMDILLQK